MFIYTAKISKKKAVFFLIALAILLCAIIMAVGYHDRVMTNAATDLYAKNNEMRVKYITSFGWECESEPKEEQNIVIPRSFSKVYEKYNEMQMAQGFDLKDYRGLEAVRYTYKITNYPDYSGEVFCDLILYKNAIIAADIHSISLDGFMHGMVWE